MFRKNYNFWSNILFFIPLVLAVKAFVWWYVCVLTVSIAFSSLCHFYLEKKFYKSNMFFAYVLIIANLTLLSLNWQTHQYILLVGLAVCAAAGFVRTKQDVWGYSKMHGIFHVLSALICSLAIGWYI